MPDNAYRLLACEDLGEFGARILAKAIEVGAVQDDQIPEVLAMATAILVRDQPHSHAPGSAGAVDRTMAPMAEAIQYLTMGGLEHAIQAQRPKPGDLYASAGWAYVNRMEAILDITRKIQHGGRDHVVSPTCPECRAAGIDEALAREAAE